MQFNFVKSILMSNAISFMKNSLIINAFRKMMYILRN